MFAMLSALHVKCGQHIVTYMAHLCTTGQATPQLCIPVHLSQNAAGELRGMVREKIHYTLKRQTQACCGQNNALHTIVGHMSGMIAKTDALLS